MVHTNAPRTARAGSIESSSFSGKKGKSTQSVGLVSAATLARLTAEAGVAPSDSVVVSKSELQRMQSAAVQLSLQAQVAQGQNMLQSKEEKLSKSKERKQRMLQMEAERKARDPELTLDELETLENEKRIRENAIHHKEENTDDVKHMNQMVLYAKCVSIRDQQIAEKAALKKKAEEEQRQADALTELNRQMTLKAMEEKERQKAAEQKQGAMVIIEQMKEREHERLRDRERKAQEAQDIVAQIQVQQQLEQQDKYEKKAAGRKLLEEILRANEQAALEKKQRRQAEIDEDQRIADYVKAKEQRDLARDEELKRIKAAKDKEVALLRQRQEKQLDRQSEIDAVRARRHQEASDRKWRDEQKRQAENRQAQLEEIALAREQQTQQKERLLVEQALKEREEYDRVLTWQAEQNELEAAKRRAEREQSALHRNELLSQIVTREKQRAIDRQSFVEEGKKLTREMEAEKSRLEAIKQKKLELLEKAGVPEKYRAELAKKKVLHQALFKG